MSKIKNIYCFGTSHTAGGGFEWEGIDSHRVELLNKIYGKLDIPKTQWDYSWPGRLQNILQSNEIDINVVNYAKQGYGNERIYRKTIEVLLSKNFKIDESIFVIELSWLNRREYFLNELNDYVICNYGHNKLNNNKLEYVNISKSYFYDNSDIKKLLSEGSEYHTKIFDFLELTLNPNELEAEIYRNLSMFISFLNHNKVNYYISSMIPISPKYYNLIKVDSTKILKYKYNDIEDEYLESFIEKSNLSITNETNGNYVEPHSSLFGNTLIATQIYNKMIMNGDILSNLITKCPKKIDLVV